LGDLDHIEFKIKGFKTFVEKFLVNQNPEKYSKISVKYDNQIVTTLNNGYKPEEDSLAIEKPKEILEKPLEKRKRKSQHKKKKSKKRTAIYGNTRLFSRTRHRYYQNSSHCW
jgi:cell division protein FtsQ